jgi:multisubunit Na+/H+ antiporter MnhB subunit
MDWGTLIVLSIGWSIICAAIAIRKNREPVRWAIAGFVMGIFTIIALAILPKLEKN